MHILMEVEKDAAHFFEEALWDDNYKREKGIH